MPAGNLTAEERRAEYNAYLDSATWQEKRVIALKRAEHRCQLCNSAKRLDVHHRTYERFGGEELPGDLTVLCRGCHEHFHDGRRPGSRSSKPAPPVLSSEDAQQRVLLLVEYDLVVGKAYTTGSIAVKARVPKQQTVPTLDWLATKRIRIGTQERILRKTKKKKWILEAGLTESVLNGNGRSRIEPASKTEARQRVAEIIATLEPGTYYTVQIAELAQVPVSRAGGYLGGFARRHEGVEQLGNKRWRIAGPQVDAA